MGFLLARWTEGMLAGGLTVVVPPPKIVARGVLTSWAFYGKALLTGKIFSVLVEPFGAEEKSGNTGDQALVVHVNHGGKGILFIA